MEVVTQEARAWMRAQDVAGVELPDEINEARRRLEQVETQVAGLPQETKPPTAAALMAAGRSLEEATAEAERLAAAEKSGEDARRTVREALYIARRTFSRLVAEQRDDLVHRLRPVVADLVEQARPLAAELAPYAPKYDAGAIVRKATPAQIKAWRKAEELAGQFGTCLAAWRSSFKASNVLGGYKSPSQVPGFDVRWIDEVHRYWERPERVTNPRLNGTHLNQYGTPTAIAPTVLSVASEPAEAGFVLRTSWELNEVYDAQRFAKAEEARALAAGRRRGRGMSV